MTRDIGLDIQSPEKECDDVKCPFHGRLSVRGSLLDGVVISSRMERTVVVERTFERKIQKYERFEKRRSRIHAHNPPCIDAVEGDRVRIAECRPLSKTKSFVVVEVQER
ncbi:30S ribosomal protein S17 [Methanosarcinales archaeon ex4572_44]|nr:MAG: 30S ribosomal protein S17 [Methanosarcinales archaeon ex4484_138]PHP46213.1 MAG: 30S ribosomal protein S17 [Methanosarcinales archaeon ex4572_44]RLG26759.1 MAG: 30S ribosomal protein S17 [Methanosarcinales archaeon]HHI30303.1 30S ribosomal protein S17 [Candidatus Methanoperedenaceae archaeon]